MPHQGNLAARAGRWSAPPQDGDPRWLAFVIAAVVIGGAAGINYQRDEDLGTGESGRADKIIAAGFADHASEQVLVQSRGPATLEDPLPGGARRRRAPSSPASRLSPRSSRRGRTARASCPRDRRSTLVQFDILGDSEGRARPGSSPCSRPSPAARRPIPHFRIEAFGDASARRAISEAFEEDARRAEFLSLPITLLILVAAFGALVAAGIPLLLGLTAVAATVGLLGPVSQVIPLAERGLLGRPARSALRSAWTTRCSTSAGCATSAPRAAATGPRSEVAAATSGRAVLISGLTVMVAMSGMFVVAHPVFSSFAIGTIMVVAVAMVGSITVVPATLAALGDRIDKGRLPFTGRRGRTGESGAWAAIIRRVLSRPWLAAARRRRCSSSSRRPTLRLHTADAGAQALPRDLAVMRTYDRIQHAFPGGPLPAVVAVQIPRGRALSVTVALKELRERALATGLLQAPFGFSINDDRTVAVITMAVAGKGTDATSDRALAALRDDVLPATLGARPACARTSPGPRRCPRTSTTS